MRGALDRLTAVGGTAMGLGLERGLEAARTPVPNQDGTGTQRLPAVLVLLSDGKDTQGGVGPIEIAQRARKAGIPIYAIALGTPDGEVEVQDSFGLTTRIQVPPDTETLKEIARISRGRFYEAADSAKLEEIYAGLGTQALLQGGQGGGHRGLRRRRAPAPAARRHALHRLVRPPV